MADEIKADYDQLEQVASRLSSQAQVAQDVIQMVRASMEKLENGGWIGRGADAFFGEMYDEIFPACQRLVEVLNEASQATRDIVQTMQRAEDEASAPFRNR